MKIIKDKKDIIEIIEDKKIKSIQLEGIGEESWRITYCNKKEIRKALKDIKEMLKENYKIYLIFKFPNQYIVGFEVNFYTTFEYIITL